MRAGFHQKLENSAPSRSYIRPIQLCLPAQTSLNGSTPAMVAGVTERLSKFDDLFSEVSARYLDRGMYTHAREFPHLAGKSDDEIRAIARQAMARNPHLRSIARWRNRVVFSGMGIAILVLVLVGEWRLGQSMLVVGGVATVFVLLWNVVWVNTVLFRITRDEVIPVEPKA